MKNIVFIPFIDLGPRSDPYKYSIKSWEYWCKKHDYDLFLMQDLVHPDHDFMKITWQRYYMFDILDINEVEYNQVLLVDADTIIHPDCPDFFELTEHKYCGVVNDGDYEWVNRSIEKYSKAFFGGMKIDPWTYMNGGFHIVNKEHREFFKIMEDFYLDNSQKLLEAQKTFMVGTDQTPLNFLQEIHNVDKKILPTCFNLQDLARKNLLYFHPQHWWTDELHFTKSGWIYHFNAIPQNQMNRNAAYWIERTYKELYDG